MGYTDRHDNCHNELIAKEGLRLVREYLGITPNLLTSGSDDVVFVALDFEGTWTIKRRLLTHNIKSEIGLAILDTRDLMSSPPEDITSTYNFTTGSDRNYECGAKYKFLFGEPIAIHQLDMLGTLNSLIPRSRKIVLVGHDVVNELEVLSRLGFDLQTSIVAVLDTQKIFVENLPQRLQRKHRLCHILEELQCDFESLHNAGNDAHFTLQALLLLALRNYDSFTTSKRDVAFANESIDIIDAIQAITTVPLPLHNWQLKGIARLEKERRRAERRAGMSPDELRAERAARKAEQEIVSGENLELPWGCEIEEEVADSDEIMVFDGLLDYSHETANSRDDYNLSPDETRGNIDLPYKYESKRNIVDSNEVVDSDGSLDFDEIFHEIFDDIANSNDDDGNLSLYTTDSDHSTPD